MSIRLARGGPTVQINIVVRTCQEVSFIFSASIHMRAVTHHHVMVRFKLLNIC
jgi:hypothetical protein